MKNYLFISVYSIKKFPFKLVYQYFKSMEFDGELFIAVKKSTSVLLNSLKVCANFPCQKIGERELYYDEPVFIN